MILYFLKEIFFSSFFFPIENHGINTRFQQYASPFIRTEEINRKPTLSSFPRMKNEKKQKNTKGKAKMNDRSDSSLKAAHNE